MNDELFGPWEHVQGRTMAEAFELSAALLARFSVPRKGEPALANDTRAGLDLTARVLQQLAAAASDAKFLVRVFPPTGEVRWGVPIVELDELDHWDLGAYPLGDDEDGAS